MLTVEERALLKTRPTGVEEALSHALIIARGISKRNLKDEIQNLKDEIAKE